MSDFPLTAFFNYGAAAMCLLAFSKMYVVLKKEKDNDSIRYLFYGLVFISVYFFANGLPLFFLNNSFFVTLITSIFRPFLLIAGMFFSLVPISLVKLKRFEKYYFYSLTLVIIASSALTIIGLIQINRIIVKKVVGLEYLIRPENDMMIYGMILVGFFFAVSVFGSAIYYFVFGMRNKRIKIVFGKSLMLGLGSLCFSLGVAINYIYGITPENFVATSTGAGILFMIGAFSFLSSVNYKGGEKIIKK
jgi:hypothetical protein